MEGHESATTAHIRPHKKKSDDRLKKAQTKEGKATPITKNKEREERGDIKTEVPL